MEIEEAKKIIRQNVKVETRYPKPQGGQHCGMPSGKVVLTSEELDIEIIIGYHRSNIRNRELAITLFELAMDDLVK